MGWYLLVDLDNRRDETDNEDADVALRLARSFQSKCKQ